LWTSGPRRARPGAERQDASGGGLRLRDRKRHQGSAQAKRARHTAGVPSIGQGCWSCSGQGWGCGVTAEPAYRRVVAALRKMIESGELREGDRLPSVRVIAGQHGVPLGTASRAIVELQAEGLVIAKHGSGVYVRQFRSIRRSSPSRLACDRWGTGGAI